MSALRHLPAITVNDVHGKLNHTPIAKSVAVHNSDAIRNALAYAERRRLPLAIAGGRHAMGGQQFAANGVLLDMRPFNRILHFDGERGTITVEAGIQWPELIRGYLLHQHRHPQQWGIRQKQTGADRLSIGGAIAANIHGRGLTLPPFAADVIAFTLLAANGEILTCSRSENSELFRYVIGGYGLFGAVLTVTLQLVPRQQLERVVRLETLDGLADAFAERIADGYLYGDFQFAIDPANKDFLHRGVFSCYRPIATTAPVPKGQLRLSKHDWQRLLYLAHTDKSKAFKEFADFYLASSGQRYWSDTHQLSIYLDDYHRALDARLKSCPATEIITELYVPLDRLAPFMATVRDDFRTYNVDCVYGTIRLIERDRDSFLAWARQSYSCIIFNLHTEHSAAGIDKSAAAFRRLIDYAIQLNGSYFLTYHRFASREQLLSCYPQFDDFLAAKRHYDPDGRWQNNWYRHYQLLLD